jgi:hypothetical protein
MRDNMRNLQHVRVQYTGAPPRPPANTRVRQLRGAGLPNQRHGGRSCAPGARPCDPSGSPPGELPVHTGMPANAVRELVACRPGLEPPSSAPPLVRFKAFARAGAGTAEYIRVFISRCNSSLGACAQPVYMRFYKLSGGDVGSSNRSNPAGARATARARGGTAVPTAPPRELRRDTRLLLCWLCW